MNEVPAQLLTLYSNPAFWQGAINTRTLLIQAAEQEASTNSKAMLRSERLIALQKGERPLSEDLRPSISPEDCRRLDEAIADLKVLQEAAKHAAEDPDSPHPVVLPEFDRWLAHNPEEMRKKNAAVQEIVRRRELEAEDRRLAEIKIATRSKGSERFSWSRIRSRLARRPPAASRPR